MNSESERTCVCGDWSTHFWHEYPPRVCVWHPTYPSPASPYSVSSHESESVSAGSGAVVGSLHQGCDMRCSRFVTQRSWAVLSWSQLSTSPTRVRISAVSSSVLSAWAEFNSPSSSISRWYETLSSSHAVISPSSSSISMSSTLRSSMHASRRPSRFSMRASASTPTPFAAARSLLRSSMASLAIFSIASWVATMSSAFPAWTLVVFWHTFR